MSVKGDPKTLRGLAQRMRAAVGEKATAEIARRTAPELTRMAGSAYDSGMTIYGTPRPRSTVDGRPLTLVRTGAARRSVRYTARGSSMVVAQGPTYRRYLIDRYDILPSGSRAPVEWIEVYRRHAMDVVIARMRGKRK